VHARQFSLIYLN